MAMTAPEAWTVVADRFRGFSLRIPSRTPSARPVTIDQTEDDGAGRVHAQSPDGSELYVEIVAYPGLIDHREAAIGERTYLTDWAPDGRLSRVRAARVAGLPGTGFMFTGTLGGYARVRRFVFVDSAERTYRVVWDPTSPLNRRVLRSLVIVAV